MRLVMSSVSASIRESTSAPPTKWRGDKGRPQPTGPLAIFCVRWSNSVRFKAWYLERCWPREFGRTVERPLPPFLASVTAGIVPNHSAFRKRNRLGCPLTLPARSDDSAAIPRAQEKQSLRCDSNNLSVGERQWFD